MGLIKTHKDSFGAQSHHIVYQQTQRGAAFAMRTAGIGWGGLIAAILLILILAPVNRSFAASGSRSIVLFRYQGLSESDQWIISEAKILATPEWDVNTANIPIAPDKAWGIAKDSLKKQGFSQPQLVKIEICPFVPETEKTQLDPGVQKRFYYRIQCSRTPHVEGKAFDYGYVIILMDGSVLDPKINKT